jgi:predicted negative regulator of RcsB-dependent stress response
MELMAFLVEIIPTVGFPILCVGALGWFVYRFYNDSQKQNAEREEKLYTQLGKQTEINEKFANIIAQYEVKLDTIQTDISDIKSDISIIMNK